MAESKENREELGWISAVRFGTDDCGHLGLHFSFSGHSFGVCSSIYSREPGFLEKIEKLLEEARVNSVEKLTYKPVKMSFDGYGMALLTEWRLLTEVIPS